MGRPGRPPSECPSPLPLASLLSLQIQAFLQHLHSVHPPSASDLRVRQLRSCSVPEGKPPLDPTLPQVFPRAFPAGPRASPARPHASPAQPALALLGPALPSLDLVLPPHSAPLCHGPQPISSAWPHNFWVPKASTYRLPAVWGHTQLKFLPSPSLPPLSPRNFFLFICLACRLPPLPPHAGVSGALRPLPPHAGVSDALRRGLDSVNTAGSLPGSEPGAVRGLLGLLRLSSRLQPQRNSDQHVSSAHECTGMKERGYCWPPDAGGPRCLGAWVLGDSMAEGFGAWGMIGCLRTYGNVSTTCGCSSSSVPSVTLV